MDHLSGCCCPTCASAPVAESGGTTSDGGSLSLSASTSKPVYTSNQVIYAMTTMDGTFSSVAWSRDQISFSIDSGQLSKGDPDYQPEYEGYTDMTAFMEQRARQAFQLWDDLIAVELAEVANNPNANILFNYSTETSDLSYARYNYTYENNQPRSTYTMRDAQIWMNANDVALDQDSDLTWWRIGMHTYLHEIGHALGITHPGQYNISANYAQDATHVQDTRQYTVMSYFNAEETGADHVDLATRAYGGTPLLHDILTAQAIYGADMTTRTGDTTYGFNSTAGREAFDFWVNTLPVVAIWDAGGTDKIDVSGFSQDQVIDLREGAFSSVGPLTQNLAIAYGAVIERAVGGAGNDHMTGNGVSNAFWGNEGDDTLLGGDGTDGLFGGPGADHIDGGAGEDWLRFAGAAAGVQVSLQVGIGTKGEAAGDTYVSIERVSGSAWGDTLQGDAGNNQILGEGGNDVLRGFGSPDYILGGLGNDTIEGGTQNDVLRGGPGADRIDGGVGDDWAQYLNASAPVAADLAAGGGSVGEAAGDIFISIENLGGSLYDDTLAGNDNWNIFLGEGGNDLIIARGGADMVRGNAGEDTLQGGTGDDTLVGGPGADRLEGGSGRDWADYQDALGPVDISLVRDTGTGSDAEGDILVDIEWLWGGAFDDTIEGDEGVNLLRGGAGNDTITSHGGGDYLKGQGGADVFVFGPDDGLDRIYDFETSADLIHFASGTISSFGELTINDFKGDASLVYAEGDSILLIGVAPEEVHSGLFTFA